MKFLNRIFLTFIFLGSFVLTAQEKPANMQKLAQKYSEYFTLNREAIFLHLNKTTVVSSENIWFSAYVYNPKFQEPSLPTTNLHVNLYNDKGKIMEAKTVFIKKGQGAGYFELDSTYSPGKYLIKASTKYMDNFREDLSFSQTFQILGQQNKVTEPIKYDLQLLPEGGYLVANIPNTVAVKLIDNSGKGVVFTNAKIIGNKGETISTFNSNQFGLSKFQFTPKIGVEYTVLLTTEHGKEIQKTVPKPQVHGISMITNTMIPGKVIFSIKTNQKTFDNLESNVFWLAYHRDGLMKGLKFILPEKSLEANIVISDDALYTGMNIITVFNQKMEPILERLIFNRNGIQRKQLSAGYKMLLQDSLLLDLQGPDSLGPHTLSISVLPAGTKSYQPRHNILSAFYIKPYIKGNLENGAYYFSEKGTKRRRNYDLNLLLLTQGWSKYPWQNIFNNTPKELYEPEHGFTIFGRINNRNEKKENQVFLKSKENQLFTVVDLTKNGSFKFEHAFLKDSTSLAIGLINQRSDKVSKPPIYLKVLPAKNTENSTNLSPNFEYETITDGSVGKPIILPQYFVKSTVSLDSILLESEIEEPKTFTAFGAKKIMIDEHLAGSFFYVTGLIRFKGFRVIRNASGVSVYSTRGSSITSGPRSPLILLNGMPLYDNTQLLYLQTKDLESIIINKSGAGYGLSGGGGVIKLQTKKNYYSRKKNIETTSFVITNNGFAPNKEFYTPKYTSYISPAFEKYGVIDWFPSVSLDENGKATLKIYNTLQSKIKLFVEGMTGQGALISEQITLETY